MNRNSTEDFISKSQKVHCGKYDYSKSQYYKWNIKTCIICPDHGEFWQTPFAHMRGQGCPKCGKISCGEKLSKTTEDFISKAKEVHGDKYDYSEVKYVNNHTPVKIICREHGPFYPTPANFLNGSGCLACSGKEKSNTDKFIEKAKSIHGNKYDYSKTEYSNNHTKVCIICPKHGEFWQTPNHHLKGQGCPFCAVNKKLELSDFIRMAKEVHGDKYDYSKSEYVNRRSKIEIICPIHGPFMQCASNHLLGSGCPKCKRIQSKLESEIKKLLIENNIEFEEQKRFDWLKYKNGMSLDFYLPKQNIAIECQGEQHFKEVTYFGGKKNLEYLQNRDKRKEKLCKKNNIKLLYYSNKKYEENVIVDKNNLIEIIKNG